MNIPNVTNPDSRNWDAQVANACTEPGTIAVMIETGSLKMSESERRPPCFLFVVANCNRKAANFPGRKSEYEIGNNVLWKRSQPTETR